MKQISSPNISVIPPQPYYLNPKKNFRRKDAVKEPMIDYDQSDGEDVFESRFGKNRRSSKLMEIGGQAAVFVATPAAAEIMRRQNGDRIMFARPM